MVDYYADLNIDKNLNAEEINKELSKLESIWKKRELTSPEKATKMLVLIIDAREVFKSRQSKAVYDRDLEESRSTAPKDPDKKRRDELQRWKREAKDYYDRREYDLAKISVDRALALTADSSDDDLYVLAAAVYMDIREYTSALSFINNAIVTNPKEASYYFMKACIYEQNAAYEEEMRILQIGLSVADSNQDQFVKARLLGVLAYVLYFHMDTDEKKAEELAKEAVTLGEDLGNGQKVIDAAEKAERERAEQREEERKGQIYDIALRMAITQDIEEKKKAIAKLEEIVDYKDARFRIENIEKSIQYIKAQEEAARYSEKLTKIMIILIIIVAVGTILFGIIA